SPGQRPAERGIAPPQVQDLKGRKKLPAVLLTPFQGLGLLGCSVPPQGVALGWTLAPLRGWKTATPSAPRPVVAEYHALPEKRVSEKESARFVRRNPTRPVPDVISSFA